MTKSSHQDMTAPSVLAALLLLGSTALIFWIDYLRHHFNWASVFVVISLVTLIVALGAVRKMHLENWRVMERQGLFLGIATAVSVALLCTSMLACHKVAKQNYIDELIAQCDVGDPNRMLQSSPSRGCSQRIKQRLDRLGAEDYPGKQKSVWERLPNP